MLPLSWLDVGEVIHFAQAQQRQGRYVSLYLSYEAAKYFNHVMCTHSLAKDDIYAVAIVLKSGKHKFNI